MWHELSLFRYLGIPFNDTGAAKLTVHPLNKWLLNLRKSPQKLDILKMYLIPRTYYGLETTTINSHVFYE